MSLRQSPQLTPASLAARRTNARKSTGPRTPHGKARVALNALKHGRYATGLPERLARARCPKSEARWHEIRARIAEAFGDSLGSDSESLAANRQRQTADLDEKQRSAPIFRQDARPDTRPDKRIDRLASWVWCSHRGWQHPEGTKLECPLDSEERKTRLRHPSMTSNPSRILIHNPWARLGLVFYTQRRRGWVLREVTAQIRGGEAPQEGVEAGLRSRVYRLARPRFWERIRYCLDRDGYYHPEWRGAYRELRRQLRNSPMAIWLEPHPIRAAQQHQADGQ